MGEEERRREERDQKGRSNVRDKGVRGQEKREEVKEGKRGKRK
jgi:hypothetical protein